MQHSTLQKGHEICVICSVLMLNAKTLASYQRWKYSIIVEDTVDPASDRLQTYSSQNRVQLCCSHVVSANLTKAELRVWLCDPPPLFLCHALRQMWTAQDHHEHNVCVKLVFFPELHPCSSSFALWPRLQMKSTSAEILIAAEEQWMTSEVLVATTPNRNLLLWAYFYPSLSVLFSKELPQAMKTCCQGNLSPAQWRLV